METVEDLKMQIEKMEKQGLRRARITSLILAGAFVFAVLFMIYGLTKDIEATRNLEMANARERQASLAKVEADKQRDIANEQTNLALQTKKELEAQIMEMEKALMDCRKKK